MLRSTVAPNATWPFGTLGGCSAAHLFPYRATASRRLRTCSFLQMLLT
jgi:hypothetical protein